MKSFWMEGHLLNLAADYVESVLDSEDGNPALPAWEIRHLFLANGSLDFPDEKLWSRLTVNQEYWTHLAFFSELKSSMVYKNADFRLEYRSFDMVLLKNQQPWIAIEVKKSESEGDFLLQKIDNVLTETDVKVGSEAWRRVSSLRQMHPEEYWVITPEKRWKFCLLQSQNDFKLQLLTETEAVS